MDEEKAGRLPKVDQTAGKEIRDEIPEERHAKTNGQVEFSREFRHIDEAFGSINARLQRVEAATMMLRTVSGVAILIAALALLKSRKSHSPKKTEVVEMGDGGGKEIQQGEL